MSFSEKFALVVWMSGACFVFHCFFVISALTDLFFHLAGKVVEADATFLAGAAAACVGRGPGVASRRGECSLFPPPTTATVLNKLQSPPGSPP